MRGKTREKEQWIHDIWILDAKIEDTRNIWAYHPEMVLAKKEKTEVEL